MDKVRKLKVKDSARIKCQGRADECCPAQATQVTECHWSTGNTRGVSFFYHCAGHVEVVK